MKNKPIHKTSLTPTVVTVGLIMHQAARKHKRVIGQTNIALLLAFKQLERTRNIVTAEDLRKILPFIEGDRLSELKKDLRDKYGYLTNPKARSWKLTPAGNIAVNQLTENIQELSQQAGELYALFEDM